MNRDEQQVHERARRLIAAARLEGIPVDERAWLDRHVESCAACAEEAAAVDVAIGALRASPVLADAEMVRRTRLAVRRRAEDVRMHRARAVPLWIVGTLSIGWMVLTIPSSWWALAWLARAAGISDPVWQGTFLMCWFLPATIVTALIACRHAGEGAHRSDWNAQLNRGHV